MITIFSRRIRKIPHLIAFLEGAFLSSMTKETTGIAGWGHKASSSKARKVAKKHGVPYVAIEDGFYRSLDLGCHGAAPLSLVLDYTGIYYDATQASDLENLLSTLEWETPELLESARHAMAIIVDNDLSKYNHAPSAPPDLFTSSKKKRVLVIDQTLHDASVALGLANANTFSIMLDEAQNRFPDAEIVVKTHPDVLAGKKRGYLTQMAQKRGIAIIAQDVSPLSLLKQVDVVFAVTSQMGFEALLLGKEVHCFGMPFYAGWGLTIDRQTCSRRTQKRSMEALFAATCLLYARYVHPIQGIRCGIHEILHLLTLQRQHNEANRGFHACVGYSFWKHVHARAFLQSTQMNIRFFKKPLEVVLAAKKHRGDVVAWSSKVGAELDGFCREHGVPLIRMEDGFIRSVGLGSDFNWPYSLILDRQGMYYNPHVPSDLEQNLATIRQHPGYEVLCQQALELRTLIVEKGLTKYNMGTIHTKLTRANFPSDKVLVLVPGQVEDDASVRLGGYGLHSNLELLRMIAEKIPEACIIYKPHPDVEKRNRKGAIPDNEVLAYADYIVRDEKMDVLLTFIDEVHTLTSLTGFEALMRGIPVHTYGGPFYAGWGLTHDMHTFSRRTILLTLDELVAGTLLMYPAYYDWQTKNFCLAKDTCARLLQPQGQRRSAVWARCLTTLRETYCRIFHI